MEDPLMRDVYEVTLSYTFLSVLPLPLRSSKSETDSVSLCCSRARRDDYGNLVPAESPISGMNPIKKSKVPKPQAVAAPGGDMALLA